MNERNNLKNRTISGMIWSFSDTIGTQFVQLLVQIFLARLLMPEDFGIIGMVTVFIALFETFIDSGFTQGLIREKDTTQEDYSTVFLFNLGMSFLLYLILFISSDLISQFFQEPKLVSIIRILSIVLIINAFGLIQKTMLIKNINFKIQSKINITSSIIAGIIAIMFAIYGFGVWSLVINIISKQFLQALLFSIANRWVPSFCFNVKSFKRLFSFGWKLLVSRIFTTIYENIYYLIIGRSFSAADLGFYTNARKLKDTIASSISNSVQKVSYPVLSTIQDDEERLKRGYRQIIKNSVFIHFPLMFGLVATAPLLLRILLGKNWIPAIPYFQILCLGGLVYPLHSINLNILQVKGRSDLYLLVNFIKKVVGFSLIAVVIFLKLGILGLLWATVVSSFISYFINAFYSEKLLSYSVFEQIKDVMPIFLISMLMGIFTHLTGRLIEFNLISVLIIQVMVGITVYLTLCKITKIDELKTVFQLIRLVSKKFKTEKTNM